MIELLPLLMFVALIILLLSGFPVAFVLGGTGLLFACIGHYADAFWLSDLGFIPARVFGIMNKQTLIAVPLFILMGLILEKSKISEDLITSITQLFQGMRTSAASAIVLVGSILAASTGIVGATVVTMGILALPVMLKQKYNPSLACGIIASSGTLGQIIPPSIVLVILGDIMNVDVGDLFVGALLPGILLVLFYLLFINLLVFLKPHLFPNKQPKQEINQNQKLLLNLIKNLLGPIFLIFMVLGSILTGIASPTEAASTGVFGALAIARAKTKFAWNQLTEAARKTCEISAMVFMILIGAQIFGVVFRGLEGDLWVSSLLNPEVMGKETILLAVMLFIFILGFFLDFLEISFIVIPIVLPTLIELGFNPLWLAILIALNLQTSFLTPPFGFALFYLKGVVPKHIKTKEIYLGVLPFIAIQSLVLALVAFFPAIVTYLPKLIFS